MNSGNKSKNNVTPLRKRQPAVLVIEHQILMRASICETLREWGFKVYEAGNGDDAVALIKSRAIDVGFVLVDLDVPGPMSGIELTNWLRQNIAGVSAVLASSDRKKSALAADLGTPFIAKPYDTKKLLVIIRNALPRRR